MADINYNQVIEKLNTPDLTVNAVKDLLDKAGITTQEAADAWAQKNAAPGQPGVLGDIEGAAKGVASGVNKTLGPGNAPAWVAENVSTLGAPEITRALLGAAAGGGSSPAPAKTAKKKGAATDSTSSALQAISDYLTSMSGAGEAAMGAEGQQLAQQNQAVTSTVDQFLTGTPSGNAAVDAAQAAYAKAYSAGEGLNSAAYANMGAANAQYLAAAPEQPIVNLLTQGLGSGQFKELPQSLIQNLPESVQYALAQAGVGESQGTSAAPSYGQPIPAPKGGWPKSLTGGGSNASGSSASQLAQIIQGLAGGTNPNINTSLNPTTTPGNPNTPGA